MIPGNLSDRVLAHPPAAPGQRWDVRRTTFKLVLAAAAAAVGFIGTCCAVRWLIPDPLHLYAEIRSEKLALAVRWAPMVTVAAFGSSHVDTGFDPRAFDTEISPGATHPISLNLGVAGGSQIEQTVVAREYERQAALTASRPGKRLLLVEANSGVNFTPKFMTHPRSINIYDLAALRLAVSFSDPKLGRARALGRSSVAVADFLLNFMNVGMLSSQLFPPPMNAGLLADQSVADRRGLSPPPPSAIDVKDRQDIEALMRMVPKVPGVSPAILTPGLCAEADSLVRDPPGRLSFVVVYFVTPKLTDLRSFDVYPDAIACGSGRVTILNVAQPPEHPELYDPTLWHDVNHLNERGAAVFSMLLAREMRRTLGGEPAELGRPD